MKVKFGLKQYIPLTAMALSLVTAAPAQAQWTAVFASTRGITLERELAKTTGSRRRASEHCRSALRNFP